MEVKRAGPDVNAISTSNSSRNSHSSIDAHRLCNVLVSLRSMNILAIILSCEPRAELVKKYTVYLGRDT